MRHVFQNIVPYGQVDVVQVKRGELLVEGNSGRCSSPSEFSKRGGNYLLTNGGFFWMRRPQETQHCEPVGDVVLQNGAAQRPMEPIPQSYAQHYKRLVGARGTYIWTGPPLKERINLRSPEFQFNRPGNGVIGSLSHADGLNERLVIVTMTTGDKFLFTYTGERRGVRPGVTLERMREIVKHFLWEYFKIAMSSSRVDQILNLDGGGSIYLSWNSGHTERVIAKGQFGDDAPDGRPLGHIRDVANFLKITPG
jgi:hypothetical protein